jgi:hypothetical protein
MADRSRAAERIEKWNEAASTRPEAHLMMLRQQRVRFVRTVKPMSPVGPDVDPWQLAADALAELSRFTKGRPEARRELEGVAEAIRQLAWGPVEVAAPDRVRSA